MWISQHLAPLAVAAVCGAGVAQGTLTDGNVRFTLGAFPPPGVAAPQPANFTASTCVGDVLNEARWLWRVPGDLDATPLLDVGHGAFSQSWNGATAALTWRDLGSHGLFDARLAITVASTAPASGLCQQELTITNLTAAPRTLDLFFYADVDQNGSFVDDRTLPGSAPHRFVVGDDEVCGGCTEVWGDGPSRYEIDAYPNLILNLLLAGNAFDCRDRGVPFGPGDFTGAMQWTLTVPPGGSVVAVAVLGHDDLHVGSAPSVTNSGLSTPGAAGAPTCSAASGGPVLGAPYAVALTEPTGAATSGTLLIGIGPQTPVTFCAITLHVLAPLAAVSVPFAAGAGTFRYPALCEPTWIGVPFQTQLFVVDPSGPCSAIPLIASDLHTHRYGD